ncbi:hypothetical protein PENPOL_c001G05256 [Penicillium polonicum]|uniref:Photolyase/cryptochrome alpha/beta domain-containing protein n=1 Tax=Penicillium polonicum TaxID=60169 RepID=A0A1V6P5L6_PENPO|nr:hypothetical protein PENPOL_c001G05256 [Penicillium polonicum]
MSVNHLANMKTGAASNPVVLYWHRTDLSLHDSPDLHAALALSPPVFISKFGHGTSITFTKHELDLTGEVSA